MSCFFFPHHRRQIVECWVCQCMLLLVYVYSLYNWNICISCYNTVNLYTLSFVIPMFHQLTANNHKSSGTSNEEIFNLKTCTFYNSSKQKKSSQWAFKAREDMKTQLSPK